MILEVAHRLVRGVHQDKRVGRKRLRARVRQCHADHDEYVAGLHPPASLRQRPGHGGVEPGIQFTNMALHEELLERV